MPFLSFGQSELLLLNGKSVPVLKYSVDYDASVFYYQKERASGKLVTRSEMIGDVFSVVDSLNVETVFYKPVTDELDVSQMRSYVKGYSLARYESHPYWSMAGGFVVGAGGMFVSKNPIFSPMISVAYCGAIALVKPSTDRLILEHPQFAENPDLLYGYQRSLRSKNVKYALYGSVGGVVVGAIVGVLTGYYN